MAFDPFLYVAFAIGFVAGRLVQVRGPWVGRATLATVFALVGLLGASLAGVPLLSLAETLPLALAFVAIILALTLGAYGLLVRREGPPHGVPAATPGSKPFLLPVALLGALLLGFGLGHAATLPYPMALRWALYVLLALVAFGLRLNFAALERAWIPITAAVVGAIGAALIVTAISGTSLPASLSTSFGFGWYTLAGPLVAERFGPALGLLAFLTNYLREDLTMLLAPVLGRRLRGEGLAAMGGATSMDTTLYFITRYGDADAGSLALASGLVLTVAASLILPALLAL